MATWGLRLIGGSRRIRLLKVLTAGVIALLLAERAAAESLTIPVRASDGTIVGYIDMDESPDGTGVVGTFLATHGDPPSLDAAAERCGEHHFNWFQVLVGDNMPPNGADGEPLTPPYVDPPPGGYGFPDTAWADEKPWYWDEGPDPPPGTPGFAPGYNIDDQLDDSDGDGTNDFLRFIDFPQGPSGTELQFVTWLASLNADGSVHSMHEGFSWTWSNPGGGGGGGAGRYLGPGLPGSIAVLDETQTLLSPEMGMDFYRNLVGIPEPSGAVLALLAATGLAARIDRRRRLITSK